jgi:hypothetical protein
MLRRQEAERTMIAAELAIVRVGEFGIECDCRLAFDNRLVTPTQIAEDCALELRAYLASKLVIEGDAMMTKDLTNQLFGRGDGDLMRLCERANRPGLTAIVGPPTARAGL